MAILLQKQLPENANATAMLKYEIARFEKEE
jgi:hypothetical protein